MRLHKIVPVLVFLACSGLAVGESEFGPNLYWPGDFESGFYGGIYSNNVKASTSNCANHTPEGKQSWEIKKGYQHLELLVPGYSRYQLAFHAKAKQAQTIVFKVVTPGEPGGPVDKNGKLKNRTIDSKLVIKPSEEWQAYHLNFETIKPYPGPDITEILITAYNGNEQSVFIDDLTIRERLSSAKKRETSLPVFNPWEAIENHDFEAGAQHWAKGRDPKLTPLPNAALQEIGNTKAVVIAAGAHASHPHKTLGRVIPHADLAGKRIRVSWDVNFLTASGSPQPWAAVLFEVATGDAKEHTRLTRLTGKPFWCTVGHMGRPGTFKRVSAIYEVPADSTSLYVQALVQKGVGENLVALDNFAIEVESAP